MNDTSRALARLHELLLRRTELQERLRKDPRRVKRKMKAIEERLESLDAEQAELKRLRMLYDSKVLQQKSNEAKLVDLQGKLNQASNNREYDALKDQIEADTKANEVLDIEMLDTLERIDVGVEAVAAGEAALKEAREDAKQTEAEVAEAKPRFEAEIAELEDEIVAAKKAVVPPDKAGHFARLVESHGDEAMAPIEGGACSHCFVNLMPQTRVELRQGKVIFCKTCNRLVYLTEAEG